MKKFIILFITAFLISGTINMSRAQKIISAGHPYIQYFGRWDLSDSLHARHSWPGVYLSAEFTGTKIGVKLTDGVNYYNIYIDGKFYKVFHGNQSIEVEYILAENLESGKHTFTMSKRNICFDKIFSFTGLILDTNGEILKPQAKPNLKIEFIGDSYTASESNEAKVQELEWEARYPVTNIDKGFAVSIAKHFDAEYMTTCRSGIGMLCDWQGKYNLAMDSIYDRTLMESAEPKWNFSKWIPNLVVICLGLNDLSGLRGKDGIVTEEESANYRKAYHNFVGRIRKTYPGVKILAVAAHESWVQKNVMQVVDEEKNSGHSDIYFSKFDYYEGGYVGYGHPTVETHQKIAGQIIKSIEEYGLVK